MNIWIWILSSTIHNCRLSLRINILCSNRFFTGYM